MKRLSDNWGLNKLGEDQVVVRSLARPSRIALVGVILLFISASLFLIPPPQRILSFTDLDLETPDGWDKKISNPFWAQQGEVLTGDFVLYYVANGSVVDSFRTHGSIASPDLSTGGESVSSYRVPRDGFYVVYVKRDVLRYPFPEFAMVAHGTVTAAFPGAVAGVQVALAVAGAPALLLAAAKKKWNGKSQ